MKRLFLICAITVCFSHVVYPQKRARHGETREPMVHDPVMAKERDKFYLYFTGWNVSAMSTKDMKTWYYEQDVFRNPPHWAMDSVPGYKGHTWAPDVIYHDGKYHMFYSCSTFGKNTSAIGHAYRTTLEPNDSLPWTDTGMVIVSRPGDNYNAIDPNIIIDEDNTPWMSFGSFWGGIQLVRLSEDMTGIVASDTVHTICSRVGGRRSNPDNRISNAVEAPFIFRHGGYYYLFVSFDYCCRGINSNYKVMVGRSRRVEGPYLDKEGRDMADGGGSLLIADDKDHVAIGHCSVYHFDGKDYFLAHGYSREHDGRSMLVLKEMQWNEDGWPVLLDIF